MHRAARRRVGEILHGAGRSGQRPVGDNRRGPRRGGRHDERRPAGVPREPRPAVRVLHARHGDGVDQPARGEPEPDRAGRQGGARRQLLPPHWLSQHRPRGARRRREAVRQHRGDRMIPASFDYEVADSAAHALSLLREHGEDAKLLAGGHSLLPMMKVRLAQPTVLIDIARVGELSGIRSEGGELIIGATTRHADVAGSDLVRAEVPLLAYAAGQVGDPQIRHRGTIGGSLAHADPSAALPMTLLALGGSVEITGPSGVRVVGADDFFVGPFESAVGPDELLSAVRVPRGGAVPWGSQRFVRRANDWAIVGAAAYGGRVALASMGGTALAAGASIAEAAALAAEGTSPGYDFHADADYRG